MSTRIRNKSTGSSPASKTTRSKAATPLAKKPVKQIVDGRVAKSGASKPARPTRTRVPRDPDAPVRTRVRPAAGKAPASAAPVAKAARRKAPVTVPASLVDGMPKRTRAKSQAQAEILKKIVVDALEEMKGKELVALDVREKTSITDWFIIVSGTSSRHVKSLADEVVKAAKAINLPPMGVEGEREGDWVVVDLGDVVVHVMQPRAREFYALEKLWGVGEAPMTSPALAE